jgi:hypothetical protein
VGSPPSRHAWGIGTPFFFVINRYGDLEGVWLTFCWAMGLSSFGVRRLFMKAFVLSLVCLLGASFAFAVDLGVGVQSGKVGEVPEFRQNCLKDLAVGPLHNQMAYLGFDYTSSYEFEANLTGLLQTVDSQTPEATFVRRTLEQLDTTVVQDSFTSNMYQYGGETVTDVKANYSGSDWKKQCGDQFVATRVTGAGFWMQLQASIPGADEKTVAACNSETGISNYRTREALLSGLKYWQDVSKSPACAGIKLRISFLQLGGDFSKVPAAFSTVQVQDNHLLAEVKCGQEDFSVCMTAADQLMEYSFSKNGYISTVDRNAPADSLGGPAVIQLYAKPYVYFAVP